LAVGGTNDLRMISGRLEPARQCGVLGVGRRQRRRRRLSVKDHSHTQVNQSERMLSLVVSMGVRRSSETLNSPLARCLPLSSDHLERTKRTCFKLNRCSIILLLLIISPSPFSRLLQAAPKLRPFASADTRRWRKQVLTSTGKTFGPAGTDSAESP
jgi:hypothetical protein